MKVTLLILSSVLFFSFNTFGQIKSTGKSTAPNREFNYDLLNFSSNQPGKTRVDEFIQVPYDKVQFVRSGNSFVANYTVTASVFDKSKEKLITEKIWKEKISTKDFDETSSSKNFNLSLRSFDLEPGEYFFRTSIEDEDSRKTYTTGELFKVRYLSPNFSISDIMIVSKKSEEEGKSKIIPNVSGNVVMQAGTFPIFLEVYSDTSRQVSLIYSISNYQKDVIFRDTTLYSLKKGANQIFHSFTDSTMDIGSYTVMVDVKSTTDKKTLVSSRKFSAFWSGFPTMVKNIDEAIDEMVYIAPSDELSYIKKGKTTKEKIKRYKDYWKKKDPLPSTEDNPVFDEYYRRVAYANEHFSTYIKGWKTDRGMVFITLGPPDNIDRHPMALNSKPYEVWEYYNLNRSFIFVDETGFGNYRLVTPLSGDLYRYRY